MGDLGNGWLRAAAIGLCAAAVIVMVGLAADSILVIAAPFVFAYLLSRVIRPILDRVCRGGHIPRPLAAGALVLLVAGGAVWLAVRGIRRGVDELGRLISAVAADRDGILAALGRLFERAQSLSEHIPFLKHLEDTPGFAGLPDRVDRLVESGLDRLADTVGSRLPELAMSLAGWVPGAFVFLTVMLLGCYYFCADRGEMAAAVRGLADRIAAWAETRGLPTGWRISLPAAGRRLRRLGRAYVRAYLLLGLFTFLEVFIGLSVLGIRYAFLLAWLIALVDFLPLLGTGVVLVPWGLIALLLGEGRVGVGLLILYGVCTLLRQVAEPKLFGHGLGLHPLPVLIATYAGLKLFGVFGMLLAPLCAAAVKELFFPADKANKKTTPAV